MMSLILPGLGQMYNGETRKGMLFILVAALNVVLVIAMAFNVPILDTLLAFGQQFHMKPNKMLLIVLREAYLGSPVSFILVGFFLTYVFYAVRDAYDHAAMKRRRIYPDFVIELPEATSGSYIFHFSVMVALFVIAFFFIIPPMPKSQLTEIEFVDNQPKAVQRQKVKLKAKHDSVNAGKHNPTKPVQAPQASGQKSQPQQQHQPKPQQAPAASAPKAPAPTPQPHPSPTPTPKAAAPSPHPSPAPTPAPTPSPAAPSPRPMPMPRMAPSPAPAAPMAMPKMAAPATPTAMPRMAPSPMAMPSATPMPMAAAPKAFTSPSAMPALAPSALPRAGGTGAAMPMPTARPAGGGAQGLPTLAPTPIAMGSGGAGGGMSNFAPLARSGGSQGGGSWSGPTAPGPVAAGSGGSSGGKSGGGGGPVPVAMGGGGGSKGGSGSSGGSSGPAPVRAGRGGGGQGGNGWSSGPISISPSVPRGGPGGGDGAAGNPDANNNPGGKPSVAANADVDFGPYMADLQRRIKRAWFPPRGQESRRVVVIFKVHSQGELSDLRIDKSSGVATADQAALEAVRNAAPFRPLPNGAPSVVDIQFTFDYNVFSGGRSF